jgi:hypothetical protein
MAHRLWMLSFFGIGVAGFGIGLTSPVVGRDGPRTGALTGTVAGKGDNKDGKNGWVEVRADGEEKGRRYWPVSDPKIGGPHREILAAIRKVGVGDGVRLEWIGAGDGKEITKFEVLKSRR